MSSSRLWQWPWTGVVVPACVALVGALLALPASADPCDVQTLVNPNAVVNASLAPGDCTMATLGADQTDNSFVDQYKFTLQAPGTLTMTMRSAALDSLVCLTEPTLATLFNPLCAGDDAGGGVNGLDFLLTLPLQPGIYILLANTFDVDGSPGVSQSGNYTLTLNCPGCANNVGGPMVSAVLPASRSVQQSQTATAFATVINGGAINATNCHIAPLTPVPATFFYQTTNPATNTLTGAPNTPVNLAAGAAQSFAIGFTPTAPFAPTDVELEYACDNANPADIVSGLNTLLMVADANPVPDIVALSATVGNTGVVNASPGVFAVAVSNVGVSGTINVTVDTGSATLPIATAICQTNPATSACINPLTPTQGAVTVTIDAGATPTFGVFVAKASTFPYDPAHNRIFVRFRDAVGGVDRGATSVAVDGHQ